MIFVLLRIVPGNIADILFSSAGMINPADKAQIEKDLGLDQPIIIQYAQWISGLFSGDLGYSYISEKPTLQEIAPRLPISAKLAGMALAFAVLFGIPLGVISAVRQNTPLDYVLRVVSLSRTVAAVVLARPPGPDGVRAAISAGSRSTPNRPRRCGTSCCCSAFRRRRSASAPPR